MVFMRCPACRLASCGHATARVIFYVHCTLFPPDGLRYLDYFLWLMVGSGLDTGAP
jgi:hypothetical protein